MADDPFNFDGSSSPDDCYQAWAAPGSVVANLNKSPYAPVVETLKAEKVRKCYPSPKEKGRLNFMERMRDRNSKMARLKTDPGFKSKSRFSKELSKQENKDPFGHLKCSPAMKKFILSEFEREKVSCNFLPSKQVALAVIHRYRSYIASSANKSKVTTSSPRKSLNCKKSSKLGGGKKSKLVKVFKKQAPSVGDSGFLEEQTETDIEDIDIQEFDEDDLPIPERGSFSVNPSPSHFKSSKQHLLVRYNSDNDTDDISDSSPGKTVCCSPAKPDVLMRKVAMCGPSLPCLTSSSLDQPGVTSVAWQVEGAESDQNWAEQVCGGLACGWCQACPGPEQLQLCSACSSVAYCGAQCQGQSWPSHKKVCKRMKGAAWGLKMELVNNMIKLARSGLKRKAAKAPCGKEDDIEDPRVEVVTRSKRTVQFNSQPQFEPSQVKEEDVPAPVSDHQPRSILRRGSVKLQTVLYSPPVRSLEQHLVRVREGDQEERFVQLKGHAGGSSIKRQSSVKLRNKLSELKNVKLDLSQRLEEIGIPNPPPTSTPSMIGSKGVYSSTPITSPTLVEEVKTMSSTRQSSSRVLSRRQQTPFPHTVDLDSDQELSLTPTGSEKENLDILVNRKINFDNGDSSDDEFVIGESSPLFKEQHGEGDIVTTTTSPSSQEDMFATQDSSKTASPPGVGRYKVENEAMNSNERDDDEKAAGTAKTDDNEKIVVMIPESSSESSLGEFSPLFSQESGEDHLTEMFSDAEVGGDSDDHDDHNQEDDFLSKIDDNEC